MKKMLVVAALSEAATGVALLIIPSLVGHLLFGADLDGVAATMARITGFALIALAVACWPYRDTLRAFQGMLTFGLLAMLFLAYVGINGGAGILLWPAVAAHAALSALLVRMRRKESQANMSAA